MYEYKYDAETGGIILTDTTSLVSKEPRPVYAQELDYLGVDDYLIYEKQQDVPYMWAEAARYIYKGETIFYKGIMPSEKVLDLPVDCNTLTGSVNL